MGSSRSSGPMAPAASSYLRQFLVPLVPLLLLGLLRDGVGERWYLTALLVYAPPLPLALAVTASVLPGIRRRPRTMAVLHFAIGALFVLESSGFVLTRPRPVKARADLRILTYNIYRGSRGMAPLASLIRRSRPDVVCLQESGPGPEDERGGWRDLRQELPPGWRLIRRGELAIATRLPVEAATWVPISRRKPAHRHHDRDALRVTVRMAGQSIHVVTAHLSVPTAPWVVRRGAWGWRRWRFLRALRDEQVTRLLAALAPLPGPVVLAGDMNSTPRCEARVRLSAKFVDAFAAAGKGWGYTFPARRPLLRLDYVFVDRHLEVAACRVVASVDSDHRPVVADVCVGAADTEPNRPSNGRVDDRGARIQASGGDRWRMKTHIEEVPCVE